MEEGESGMLPPSAPAGERAVVSREEDERRDHEDHEDHQAACSGDHPQDLEDGAVLGGASPQQLPGALPPPPAAAPLGRQDMSASSPAPTGAAAGLEQPPSRQQRLPAAQDGGVKEDEEQDPAAGAAGPQRRGSDDGRGAPPGAKVAGSPQQSMDERLAAFRDTRLAADSAAFTSRPVDALPILPIAFALGSPNRRTARACSVGGVARPKCSSNK